MAQIVTNIIQNSLSGMVAGAVTTVGNYAGDAVSGVGNLIEAKGQAVGNGIAQKFEGWGTGVTSYGGAVRSATAPNAGSSGYPTTKRKAITAPKKAPASSVAKKSLPSIPERKLLTAPPAKSTKSVQEKGPAKGTYEKSVAPYKQANGTKKSAYAPSMAAKSAVTTKTINKPDQAQKTQSLVKANTNAAGKVVPAKTSLPGKAGKASSVAGGYKEPYKAYGSGDNKAKTGYQGPLNLGGVTNGTGPKPSKPASAVGGGPKAPTGGYGGPLNLGGIMDADSKPKTNSQKPAPSKPASVAGGAPKPTSGGYAGPLSLGGLA